MLRAVIVALAIAAPLLGLVLLALGLRGRRDNQHPTCARCRFDLVGLHDPGTCPECGGSLGVPGAVSLGVRHKRPALITAGIVPVDLPHPRQQWVGHACGGRAGASYDLYSAHPDR